MNTSNLNAVYHAETIMEIENELQNHGYSINSIVIEFGKSFKIQTFCRPKWTVNYVIKFLRSGNDSLH
jgi:hypothetical protein